MKKINAVVYSDQNRIYVKPDEGTYEMIYRSACGVYWDKKQMALFFKDDPCNYDLSIKLIVLAMKEEYDIDLVINHTFEKEMER